jgi:hypothetical protein
MENKPSQYICVLLRLMKDTRQFERKLLVKVCLLFRIYESYTNLYEREKKENYRSVTDKQISNTFKRKVVNM